MNLGEEFTLRANPFYIPYGTDPEYVLLSLLNMIKESKENIQIIIGNEHLSDNRAQFTWMLSEARKLGIVSDKVTVGMHPKTVVNPDIFFDMIGLTGNIVDKRVKAQLVIERKKLEKEKEEFIKSFTEEKCGELLHKMIMDSVKK